MRRRGLYRLTALAAALLLLAGCGGQKTAPKLTAAIPAGGERLEVECVPYAPLEDNGTRSATVYRNIHYQYLDETIREDEETFELSGEKAAEQWPEIRLWEYSTLFGSLDMPWTEPVDGAADRAYLLELVRSAEYVRREETNVHEDRGIYVCVTEEDGTEEEYIVFSDGTLARGKTDYAYGAADYLRVRSISYKYSANPGAVGDVGGLEWLVCLREKWDDPETIPPAKDYCLCLQTEDFHMDLDRDQALALLENLFGTGEMQSVLYEGILSPAYKPAPWDWTPPAGAVRLTEHLSAALMTERNDRESDGVSRTVYLCPDGSVVLAPGRLLWSLYAIFRPIPGTEENQPIQAYEQVRPSWQRVCLAKDAFSWPMLQACLAELKK